MSDELQIEEILEEANAYNLRQEVKDTAEKIFKKNDMLLFGRESAGVPEDLHKTIKYKLKIPINKKTRSLNVAMSVAIISTEALRQNNLFQ